MFRAVQGYWMRGDGYIARYSRFAPFVLILCGLVAGYVFHLHHFLSLQSLAEHRHVLLSMVQSHPVLAPLVFFVIYVAAVAFSFPVATILSVFAGFLFGWLPGAVLATLAATSGATIVFLSAQTACGQMMKQKAGALFCRLRTGFNANAFTYLLMLRLAPICPFFLVNVAPAFFQVKWRTYVVATFLGILPGTLIFTWLGRGLEKILEDAERSGHPLALRDFFTPDITLTLAILTVIVALPAGIRLWRGTSTPESNHPL